MSSEVKAFRENVRTWLLNIDGLGHLVGARVFSGFPAQVPDFPCITMAITREPLTEYAANGWTGQLHVDIHALGPDALDAVDDLVCDAASAPGLPVTLGDTDEVQCHDFRLASIGEDDHVTSPEADRYYYSTRRLSFDYTIAARAVNQP